MIIPIFVSREGASGLAHVPPHRVSGITLPPDDATLFSLHVLLDRTVKKICRAIHANVNSYIYLVVQQRVIDPA